MPYEFECSDVIPGCTWKVTGDTREDTVDQVERHAREAHHMMELPDDLTKSVLASIQPTH